MIIGRRAGSVGSEGYMYEVNSFSSQFVLESIRSHFGQLVLIFLVNSYS